MLRDIQVARQDSDPVTFFDGAVRNSWLGPGQERGARRLCH